ncbi:MAG: hypothetical protein EA405_13620 [Rhodospirillales bacterium]|nr:MAG: hypothetical protein EA405_13620 [Rhodospirillales bacterium]
MAWTLDAPAGVYKNHALSSDVRRAAVADSVWMGFVRPERNYGKGRGESITLTRVFPLDRATRVSELDRLPTGRPLVDTKQIFVDEWGFKTELTRFEENLTHFNIRNPFQMALRDQMRLTMDAMVADAFKLTPIKYVPETGGSTITTNGTPGAQATANLRIPDLRRMHDYLRQTLKAPKFRGGKYVGILSTKAARGIKNDSEYKDWQAPTTSGPLIDGRLRDVEGFALFEANNDWALNDAIGNSGVLGEAVFFAADPVALAVVENPELRADPVLQDLGRFRQFGWYGTIGAGLVWDVAAHARVIHVSST